MTLTAYARCARIVRSAGEASVPGGSGAPGVAGAGESGAQGEQAPAEPAERALTEALAAVEATYDADDPRSVLAALDQLAPVVHQFFDNVLVMADDPAVRAGRLGLVGRVAALPRQVADLRLMEGF